MKKMKWVAFLLFGGIILSLLVFSSVASEGEENTLAQETVASDVVDSGALDENEAQDPLTEATVEQNIFTRIFEFVQQQKELIIDAVSLLILGGFAVVERRARKKTGVGLTGALSQIFRGTSAVSDSQNAVVGAMNGLLSDNEKTRESNESLRQELEQLKTAEEAKDKVVGALAVQMNAVLEILTSVYVNSKNLPQGVKDIVNLRYAKCLSAMENDAALHNCMDAVRKTIGIGESDESEESQS